MDFDGKNASNGTNEWCGREVQINHIDLISCVAIGPHVILLRKKESEFTIREVDALAVATKC